MEKSYQIFDGKVIIHARDRLCDTPEELIKSHLFYEFVSRCVRDLVRRESKLVGIFEGPNPPDSEIHLLVETMFFLSKLPADLVIKVVDGSEHFFRDLNLLNDFVEYIYNSWRSMQRLIVCDAIDGRYDKRPYRTFNRTVEQLMHIVRSTYRDIQENITGNHPQIYRQVRAGAEIATIAMPKKMDFPDEELYRKLDPISVIRQVLIYPPLIFNAPTNKRTGTFERVYQSPLEKLSIQKDDWLCYPAKVGPLLIMIYFSKRFFELGFSLANLFELASDQDLARRPDAIYLYGVPVQDFHSNGKTETIFYDDPENDILVAAIPEKNEYGYFGYLKKMALTLHNIKMMKIGRMPFHGALVNLLLREKGDFTVLLMGDTGAGKSETLEALRMIGGDVIRDITTIADDMGSLQKVDGHILGYGTETGAFVRLDDLQPGYAFGQIDRTIIMNPNQVNARVVLPVTTYQNVICGFPVDFVLYANNYEAVDEAHPIIERFQSAEGAIGVFREGMVMSKGTTSTTGQVQTYFANIFGPEQYQAEHEVIARDYFEQFFKTDLFVGQMRTQLGIPGKERSGPEEAARMLLETLKNYRPQG
ncbi:MAG TPA: hypothetical protein VMT46_09775 [Anaerolineaceae bacterium]|nr:hypothetical protein [Anaerolineaceae bacterium]